MDLQLIFRMISRSRYMQLCLRNDSISRRHMCVLSSTQFSSQTTNISLIHQETNLRCFSSFREPSTDFSSKKFNHDSPNAIRSHSDENIFSPKKRYDDNRSIFVGGLSKFTTEQLLYEHFLKFGTITGCRLARQEHNGVSKGYGFVEFESIAQAESTCEIHPHVIDDQEVNIEMCGHKELRQKFKLFIGGLSKETSVETLREYFSKFGQIAECHIPRDEVNGSRGFGFVIFKSQESVNNSLNWPHHYIDKKEVTVKLNGPRQREFTLIVGKLSPNTTDESLHAFYSRFGRLTQCNVKFDRHTGQSRRFGFVSFNSQEDLNSALYAGEHVIDGTQVELHYATNEFDVIVNSLSTNITEEALIHYFSRYGKLLRCEIIESSAGVRTGFVRFSSEKEISKVLAHRPHIINDKMVKTQQKDQDFTVFVGNLPSDATDDLLFETFSEYGKIVHWHVKRDRDTNRSLGYGFVSFEKAEQVVKAVNSGPYFLAGKALRVEPRKSLPLSKKSFK